MKLIEAAEQILRKFPNRYLTAREICDLAIQQELIFPKSNKPWVQMQAVLRKQLAIGKTSDGKSSLVNNTKGWKI